MEFRWIRHFLFFCATIKNIYIFALLPGFSIHENDMKKKNTKLFSTEFFKNVTVCGCGEDGKKQMQVSATRTLPEAASAV